MLMSVARQLTQPCNPHYGQFTAVSEATYYPEGGEATRMFVGHVDKHHSLLNIVGHVGADGEWVFMGSLDDTRCLVFVDADTPLEKAIDVYNTLSEYARDLVINYTVRLDEKLTAIYPPVSKRVTREIPTNTGTPRLQR